MTVRSRMSGQDRKESILAAAVQLFAEKGFRGTTTRELAAAVGVTEPVLYEHFKTKGELYTAIIDAKSEEGFEKLSAELGPYLEMDDDRGFFEKLAHLVLHWNLDDPAYVRLRLYSALEGHELKDLIYERQVLRFYRIITGYIERRMEAGALRRMDPELVARGFVGMLSWYSLSSILYSCGSLPGKEEDILKSMVSIFLKGVQAE